MVYGEYIQSPQVSLAKALTDQLPKNLSSVYFVNSGSEAIEGAKLMFEHDNNVIVSHRSGETNHAYIVDIAVAIGAKYLKIGSPCRGERVAKFNRLLEIETILAQKSIE